MKSFSKKEIENLINKTEEFKQAIIDSKGFILYLADKYTITLSPNLLIDTINPYSIRFISEHMNSHKYTSEQNEIVIDFLREKEEKDEEDTITQYHLNDLLNDIRNDEFIPTNAEKLLTLSFNDFLSYPKDFVKLLYRNSDVWSTSEFFSYHYLLAPVFKNLTKEEFLQIDKDTLYSCPALFNLSKHLMNDEDIRSLFNETVIAYYDHPKRKENGYKPRLDAYKNYEFQPHEKELFLTLLKNDYSSDYETVKDYKGFHHFFTKNDYILNHNISGIQYFSEKEIADNLTVIRKSITDAFFSHNYSNFQKIFQLKISHDSFKDIFKPAFIQDIIEHTDHFHFHPLERDNQKITEFINIFNKEVLILCVNNPDILQLIGYQKCIEYIKSVLEYNQSYFDNTYTEVFTNLLAQFEKATTTDVLFYNFPKRKVNCFSGYDIPALIFSSMEGKESVNYLFALMQIKKQVNSWQSSLFDKEINRVIPLLNAEDVKTVSHLLNYEINPQLLKDNPVQDFKHNFLNFNPVIIKSMHFNIFQSIFKISKEFRDLVLQEGLDSIIINEKLTNPHRSDFISDILNNTTDKESPYFSFMKFFIDKHKEFMTEHYLSQLISHPLRNDFIQLDTTLLEKDSYHKLEDVVGHLGEIYLEERRLNYIRENQSKKEIKVTEALLNTISQKKTELSNVSSFLFSQISFDFYSNKIKESDTVKAIQLLRVAETNINRYKDIILDKIQHLDFETTKKLVYNKEFLSYIFDNIKNESIHSKERPALLNKFTNEQNIELVEILLKNFNNPDLFTKQYYKNISLTKILYLIPETSRFEISNDLVIKHDPTELFHSYDYLPKKTAFSNSHVSQHYTNEQIFTAIDNLTKQGLKIINKREQNLPHSNLLSYNFKYEEMDGKNPYLNNYLSLLKNLENDPINYLACIHSDIIYNFINKDLYSNVDLAKTAFYNEHININVVNQAMESVFSIHNKMMNNPQVHDTNYIYEGVSLKNAIRAISNFLSFSYSSYHDKYESELDNEKSKILFKTILDKAPYLLFSSSRIGNLSPSEEFSSNFSNYYHKEIIEDFFIYSNKQEILSEYFSIDIYKKEQWQTKIADNFILSLITHLNEIRDEISIYKLDFIIKENKFNEHRPYRKNLKEFDSVLADLLSHGDYEHLIQKSISFNNMLRLSEMLDKTSRAKVKNNKI